jgi:hypothetical protein
MVEGLLTLSTLQLHVQIPLWNVRNLITLFVVGVLTKMIMGNPQIE